MIKTFRLLFFFGFNEITQEWRRSRKLQLYDSQLFLLYNSYTTPTHHSVPECFQVSTGRILQHLEVLGSCLRFSLIGRVGEALWFWPTLTFKETRNRDHTEKSFGTCFAWCSCFLLFKSWLSYMPPLRV